MPNNERIPQQVWDNSDKEFWSFEELAEALEKNPSTLKAHFKYIQQRLREQGIIVTKYGRGAKARYTIDFGYED